MSESRERLDSNGGAPEKDMREQQKHQEAVEAQPIAEDAKEDPEEPKEDPEDLEDLEESRDRESAEGPNGADSIRYQLLLKVIDKALQKSAECLSVENLAKCYPSFGGRTGTKYLGNAISQINRFFLDSSRKEVEAVLGEKGVRAKLALLDEVIREAEARRQRGDKSERLRTQELSPEYLVEYNMLLAKTRYRDTLQDKVAALRSDNAALLRELGEVRRESEEAVGDLESSVQQMALLSKSLAEDGDTELDEAYEYFGQLAKRELSI